MSPELRTRLDAHREERAAELFDIASLLERERLTDDAGPIRLAADQCMARIRSAPAEMPDAGEEFWGYEIENLRINLEPQRHCRPRRATMADVSGLLSVTVQEYVPRSIDHVGNSYEHIRRLDTDFHFDVHHVVDGQKLPLRAAWHVDTHLHTATPSDSVHPRFHFQVGGERLDDIDELIRGVFVPETPRMPCAPMDALLAIDFIVSHYCGSIWSMLRDLVPAYTQLRQAPMRRYWVPYYRTLSDGLAGLDGTPDGGAARLLSPSVFAA